MPSLKQQWQGLMHSSRGDNHESIGTRAGLMFDPLAYIIGDDYRKVINWTGDTLNKGMFKAGEPTFKLSRKYTPGREKGNTQDKILTWVENKPASTTGLLVGSYFGGSGLANAFGGGSGSASTSYPFGFSPESISGQAPNFGGTPGFNPLASGGTAAPASGGVPWQQFAGAAMGGQQQQRQPQQQNNDWLEEMRRQEEERKRQELIRQQIAALLAANQTRTPVLS